MLALALAAVLPAALPWRAFDDAALADARASGRLVLLDVGTAWCHWCHVMDERTYGDAAVSAALDAGFVVTRADADHRLDLAQRYGDWGWPATIVLDGEGRELLLLKGFVAPERFLRLIAEVRADPRPRGRLPDEEAQLRAETASAARDRREARWEALWEARGGWGRVHKYLHGPSIELALSRAARGDDTQRARVRTTLVANRALIDRVDGGVFQYSDWSDRARPWASPHYEKIMATQATNLRAYALASRLLADRALAADARDVARYLMTTLSSDDGAFFASQDADASPEVPGRMYYGALDPARRRALPAPRVDRARYTRETAQAAAALAEAAGYLGDPALLERAQRAVAWARAARRADDGAFAHGEEPTRYLGDTLAMGLAAWALYQATADRAELAEATRAIEVIDRTWRVASGFASAPTTAGARGALATPFVDVDENVDVARLAVRVARAAGSARARAVADHAAAHLASPKVQARRMIPSGLLLAEEEAPAEPLHLVVVGSKDDAAARALFDAARAVPRPHKVVEWLDRREGPLPGAAVEYPALSWPAAFACSGASCGRPARTPAELEAAVAALP